MVKITGKPNGVTPVAEASGVNRSKTQQTGEARGSKTDDVTVKTLQRVKKLVAEINPDEPVDMEKVAKIAKELHDGVYLVSAEMVADAILDEAELAKAIMQ